MLPNNFNNFRRVEVVLEPWIIRHACCYKVTPCKERPVYVPLNYWLNRRRYVDRYASQSHRLQCI
jgi:hypothetical protein